MAPARPQASTSSTWVSIEGQVVMEAREESQDEYVRSSRRTMFSAVYLHGNAARRPGAPMKEIPVGARMRVTGICVMDEANPIPRPRCALQNTAPLYHQRSCRASRPFLDDPGSAILSILVLFLLLSMLLVPWRQGIVHRTLALRPARWRPWPTSNSAAERDPRRHQPPNSRPLVEIIEEITVLVPPKPQGRALLVPD